MELDQCVSLSSVVGSMIPTTRSSSSHFVAFTLWLLAGNSPEHASCCSQESYKKRKVASMSRSNSRLFCYTTIILRDCPSHANSKNVVLVKHFLSGRHSPVSKFKSLHTRKSSQRVIEKQPHTCQLETEISDFFFFECVVKAMHHCKNLEVDLTQEMSSQLQSIVPGGCPPPFAMV